MNAIAAPAAALAVREKDRFEQIAADRARRHEIERVAERAEAKSVTDSNVDANGANQEMPSDEVEPDGGERAGHSGNEQRPVLLFFEKPGEAIVPLDLHDQIRKNADSQRELGDLQQCAALRRGVGMHAVGLDLLRVTETGSYVRLKGRTLGTVDRSGNDC